MFASGVHGLLRQGEAHSNVLRHSREAFNRVHRPDQSRTENTEKDLALKIYFSSLAWRTTSDSACEHNWLDPVPQERLPIAAHSPERKSWAIGRKNV